MKDKILKEYIDEVHNQDENYEKILLKTKGVIYMKKKILNIAAIFVVILLVGATSSSLYAKIKWDIEFKEFQSSPIGEAQGNLGEVRESDYAEVLNMDYVEQDGIGIKIDSILLTDDCFDAKLSFKFAEGIEVNSETFGYSFAVYDEDNNVYGIFSRMKYGQKIDNTVPFVFKEIGKKLNKNDWYSDILSDSAGYGPTSVNEQDRTMEATITLRAKDTFPQSRKIYIRVFDLGYSMYDMDSVNWEKHIIETVESFDITDARWLFEIDVPEKFYERNTVELKLDEEIPDFEIEKATISETSLVLIFKSQAYRNLITEGKDMTGNEFVEAMKNMLNITDSEGNVYQDISSGTKGEESYKMTLDVGTKDLEKGLFVNFTVDGKTYMRKLVERSV